MRILKKIGVMSARIGISLVLLIFLFRQVEPRSLLEIVKHSDKLLLWLAFFISFFGYFFCFLRWKMLLEAMAINLPLKRLISAFSGGIFFNMFLPSTVGGDFVRSADIGYHSKKTCTVVATVLLDRLSGFAGMTIVALVALIFGAGLIKDPRITLAICILAFLLFLVVLLIFNNFVYDIFSRLLSASGPGRIRRALHKVLQEMHEFKHQKTVIVKNLLLSIAVQVIGPIATYMIAVSFHLDVDIVYFYLFIPIIGAVTLLPISIGGLGVRDYMTILLFTSLGISKHFAFAFSLLGFFFIVLYAGIGGIIYGLTLHNRRV
jgi:glycosyltransferase 2 family protein